MTSTDTTAPAPFTPPAAEVVTSQFIKAVKTADTATFNLHQGVGTLRLHLRADRSSTGFEQTVELVTASRMSNYAGNHGDLVRRELQDYTCYVWEGSYHYATHRAVGFMLGRIRVGDTVTLSWVRSNNNINIDGVGWHRDELYMVIHKAKSADEVYLVDVQVGPDNTSRMIRVA